MKMIGSLFYIILYFFVVISIFTYYFLIHPSEFN